jgi:hypothetical protein
MRSTAAEQQDAFARLNELIDSWGTHAQTLLVSRRDVVPLVIGQQVYTVGPGEDVNVPTPMTLDDVAYVIASVPETEVFLDVGTDRSAVATPQKLLTGGPPQVVNYTRTHAFGELWVWPVPTVATDLRFASRRRRFLTSTSHQAAQLLRARCGRGPRSARTGVGRQVDLIVRQARSRRHWRVIMFLWSRSASTGADRRRWHNIRPDT